MQIEKSLDFTRTEFRALLNKASQLVAERFENLETSKVFQGVTPGEMQEQFDETLPESGMDAEDLLDQVQKKILDTATMNMGPHMYAYVMTGGTQVSILAEMLASTINQNVSKWHLAPGIIEIEKRVMQWLGQFIGFSQQASGVLVSGGSAANLTGLTVARNILFEKYEVREQGLFHLKPITVYASDEVHGCMDKSVELLGIGNNQLRKIETNPDYTINLDALQKQIEKDLANGMEPFCLIGNAGTVNTGAIDPLNALSDIARKYNMWFHVDGAYGGLAAAIDDVKVQYKGIEKADSVAIDLHKWLYQPFEAGCTLVKNWEQLSKSFQKSATYLATITGKEERFDYNDYHFQLSRNAKALKIWMTFKAYGTARLKQMMEKDVALTKYLHEILEQTGDFEICTEASLGIVCFRYIGAHDSSDQRSIDELNNTIVGALEEDGRVFITGTILHNRPVLRACLINHRKQKRHVDFLVDTIRNVGKKYQ